MQGKLFNRFNNKIFTKKIGKKVEVYINDIMVKRKNTNDHEKDLE